MKQNTQTTTQPQSSTDDFNRNLEAQTDKKPYVKPKIEDLDSISQLTNGTTGTPSSPSGPPS